MHDDEGCNQSFHGKSQILSEFLDVHAIFWTEPRRVSGGRMMITPIARSAAVQYNRNRR
jgi:hypothetical protein